MFKKILKWTGLVVGLVVLAVGASGFYVVQNMNGRLEQTYAFGGDPLRIPTDSAAIARGGHLAVVKSCRGCHSDDLSGKVMVDDALLGRLVAPNLTRGKGGVVGEYEEFDWIRALRHGVDPNGRPLVFMPSHEFNQLSAQDLADIIAYARQVPAVDKEQPKTELRPLAKILGYADKFVLIPAEKIDHEQAMIASVDTSEGIAFGKYTATTCQGCHRPNMKGGEPLAPGLPPVADITSSGHVGKWTREQFKTVLRTGRTPEGKQLNEKEMPWTTTAKYNDKELNSLYAYLRSI